MEKYIIGTGGVAKTIIDEVHRLAPTWIPYYRMVTGDFKIPEGKKFIIAFGTRYMKERREVWEELIKDHESFTMFGGWKSRDAIVGRGNVFCKNSTIAHTTKIGNNNFVGYGTDVDHNTKIGNHNYISPHVCITSHVKVGDGNMIGAGATIIPEVKIGDDNVIGAGTVIIRDVGDGEKWVGNPARKL